MDKNIKENNYHIYIIEKIDNTLVEFFNENKELSSNEKRGK